MARPDLAYWQKLSDTEFLFEKGCWKECDSFCCRWNRPDFNFNIIPKGGTLFYLEEEYDYMSKYKKVTDVPVYKMKLDYGGSKPLVLLYKHCWDCDNCNKLFSRSLYCKLYPFLPVFDVNGKLLDVKNISVYDVTLDIIGGSTPCSVIKNKEKYLKLWSEQPEILDMLREPYVLFHLMVANLLQTNYSEVIRDNLGIMMKEPSKFWQNWEMKYLTARLVDKKDLAVKTAAVYKEMTAIYGDFI